MPEHVIEREIRDAGKLSPAKLQAMAQKSCNVIGDLGAQIRWVHRYVTNDKVCCVYIATP